MNGKEIRFTSGTGLYVEPDIGTKKRTGPVLTGYAALFGSLSLDLGNFFEVIKRGAFADTLRQHEQRALYAHDDMALLGRTKNGTLSLEEDARGLKFTLQLPDTTLGRDVAALVQRGDLSQMSFGFSVAQNGDDWHREGSRTIRTLRKVNLSEISVVATPAYESTSVALREALAVLDDELVRALARRRARIDALCG